MKTFKQKTVLLPLLCLFGVLLLTGPLVAAAESGDEPEVEKTTDEAAAEAHHQQPELVGFSDEDVQKVEADAKPFEFQAEVSRLMDILINSLYSHREIFLRELISNAADALDKLRFVSITNPAVLGDQTDLDIKINFDKERKVLTVRDSGIGMTRDDLVKHLGTVASSGTTRFLEMTQQKGAAEGDNVLSLVGQFGVGFYSVYLVADRVTVISKHADDDQHIWQSDANRTFTVSKDPRGNTLGRGTEIQLHLKADAQEFLDESNLEKVVHKYSSFIGHPIYLMKKKTVEKEVPVEDEEQEEKDPTKPDDDEEEEVKVQDEEDDDEKKEKKPKTKTVKEEVSEWEQLNENKALWLRSPKEVTRNEYEEFYKVLSKGDGDMLTYTHFRAEGEITFKSVLFVGKTAPYDLYDKYYGKSTSLKLYVRRVLVSSEFDDLMPRYLNFVTGVVDSDDLPIQVSRETLAKNRVLRVIGKKLTRKAIQMVQKLATTSAKAAEELKAKEAEKKEKKKDEDEEKKEEKKEDEEEDEEKKEEDDDLEKLRERAGRYEHFYGQYGKSIKLGVIEDTSNKNKLVKLLRYESSKSDGKLTSLEEYVERMKEKQDQIYYITGENLESVKSSPFLEKLRARDLEVLYMVDPLDEYVTSNLPDYDGKKLMSITKEGLKFPDEDGEEDKRREKAMKEHYKAFCEWLKNIFGDKVAKVEPSNRLADSPAVITTSQFGWSANMERIMKAQTFTDAQRQAYMIAKKTLEINTRHPLVRALKARFEKDADDTNAKELAALIHDAALLRSGFQITGDEVASFGRRVNRVVSLGLDVDPDSKVAEEDDFEVPPPEEPEKEGEEDEDEEAEEVKEDLDKDQEEEDKKKKEEEEGAKKEEKEEL